jgi:hypothetical protein
MGSQKGASLLGDLRVPNRQTVENGAGTKLHFSGSVPLVTDEASENEENREAGRESISVYEVLARYRRYIVQFQ